VQGHLLPSRMDQDVGVEGDQLRPSSTS
jgi:hypothetical protein